MYDDYEKMVRVEREIEKQMEAACEKDGWYVAVLDRGWGIKLICRRCSRC